MFIALERLLDLDGGYRQVFQQQGRSLLLLVVEGCTLLLRTIKVQHWIRTASLLVCCVASSTELSLNWPVAAR